MATSTNPQFGRYILVSKLGMGGMAEVFKAQFKGNPDLLVAIKRILPQFSQDKKLISMMVNEARLSMSLSHPNIVPVLDFGQVDGDYFMAMEYIKGKDVKSIMIRCKTKQIDLPIQMSVFIISKVLRALDFAHAKRDNFDQPLGIVHRDISPHNVLISYWGDVKILDFGIAKASTLAGASTQAGILKGKFSYMSPEQSYGDEVDYRTDIFAAGVVLWELLTLESYYTAETDIKLLGKVRDAKFKDPARLNSRIPRPLIDILEKALQKKVRKRWKSAGDMADALDEYLDQTFGRVTEADLGTFVRSLFGISAQEIVQKHTSGRDLVEMINPSLAEVTPPETHVPTRAPYRPRKRWFPRFYIPDWVWKFPVYGLLFAGIYMGFKHYSPKVLWKMYNQKLSLASTSFYKFRNVSAQKPTVEIQPPNYQKARYTLYFAQGVRESMEDFPFEAYDRIRGELEDLAYDPKPSSASSISSRPGSWKMRSGSYQITYSLNDQSKTLTIASIDRLF